MLGLTAPCRHFFSCRAGQGVGQPGHDRHRLRGGERPVPQTILQRAAGRRAHVQRRPRRGAGPAAAFRALARGGWRRRRPAGCGIRLRSATRRSACWRGRRPSRPSAGHRSGRIAGTPCDHRPSSPARQAGGGACRPSTRGTVMSTDARLCARTSSRPACFVVVAGVLPGRMAAIILPTSPHWRPRRGIDPHRAPHDQRGVGQSLQHPRKHCLVGLEVNQATGARQRRVVRRGLVQGDIQKCPDAQRIGGAPRDCPFRVQPFKVAEQQQPEIAARRQTRPTDPVRVERRALCLHARIEPRLVEHPIQPLVKRVPSALRQIRRGHPHRRLPRSAAACPHRHTRQCSTRDRSCRSL